MAPDLVAILGAGNPALHRLAVLGAALAGGVLMVRDSAAWAMPLRSRIAVLSSVAMAGMIGSSLPGLIAGGQIGVQAARFVSGAPDLVHGALDTYACGPKTILGGLLFGFIGASLCKGILGLKEQTSDAFARGACAMMAIGRLGCIAQHCCFGVVVPSWLGVDEGDGLPRLPVQAIEATALFALLFAMQVMHRRGLARDRRLFLFFAAYGSCRFCLEFGREQIASTWLGLGFYQWLAALVAGVGIYQLIKRTRVQAPPATAEARAADLHRA